MNFNQILGWIATFVFYNGYSSNNQNYKTKGY